MNAEIAAITHGKKMPRRCFTRFQSAICAILTKPIAHARLDQPRLQYHSRATLQFPIGFESDIVAAVAEYRLALDVIVVYHHRDDICTFRENSCNANDVYNVIVSALPRLFIIQQCLPRRRRPINQIDFMLLHFLFHIVNLDKRIWNHHIPQVASQTL